MFKKALWHGLKGIPIGVFLFCLLAILFLSTNNMDAIPSPFFIRSIFIVSLIGFIFAALNTLFLIETWSLLKTTSIHYLINLSLSFPLLWLANWFPHDPSGVFTFLGIYTLTYLIIWIVSFIHWKWEIDSINKKLEK